MYGLVSIIMPSYNTARFIEESIKSVLAQTYTNWELIIVDDASTDNTDEIVAPYCHPREGGDLLSSKIHYLKNAQNSGAAVSRNRALAQAKGKWIAFLDSDDLWVPEKLEKQLKFMAENGYAFSYTRYEEIDEDGTPTGTLVGGPKRITKTGMFNYCWPGCLTVMYNWVTSRLLTSVRTMITPSGSRYAARLTATCSPKRWQVTAKGAVQSATTAMWPLSSGITSSIAKPKA